MNHQSITDFVSAFVLIACIIWATLFIAVIIGILKKNWTLFKRAIKYSINSSVFLIAWAMFLELALIVRPPIKTTKELSVKALESWISEMQTKDFYIAIVVIIILFVVNLFFYYKVEHKNFKRDLFILTLSNCVVFAMGIWLTGQDAYFGLLQEINLHFG